MGMITDPIADMLVRIKSANQRKIKTVSLPHSKIKEQFLLTLKNEGYIKDFKVEKEKIGKKITIFLKYKGIQRVIVGVKRISKPGLRVYATANNIPSVLSGYGIAIISTSQGLLTDKEARKANVGGEVLAYIW